MVDPSSARFISSLVKSLQMFCHGYMEFEDTIEIIGHINLRIDNRQKLDYIVNEQVSKQGQESTCFQSNSYHSLPPKSSDRDQHSGRAGDANLHHTVDASLAVLGGTRVQVDLSGPSPVTRSTFSSYHDGFLTPLGNSQTYCQSRESPALEMVQTSSLGLKDSTSVTPGDVLNHTHTKQISCSGNADRTGMELDISVAVSSDPDGQMQNSGHLQDVVIKAEPGALISPEKCGDSDSVGTPGLMDTSSCSVSAGQPASLSTSLAHTYASSLPSLALTLPAVSFDASSVSSQDMLGSERREAGQTGSACEGRTPVSLVISHSGSSAPNPVSTALRHNPFLRAGGTQNAGDLVSSAGHSRSDHHPSDVASMCAVSKPVELEVEKEDLLPATAVNNDPKGWWCGLCAKAFRSGQLLAMHMQFVHKKPASAVSVSGGQAAATSACQLSDASSSVIPADSDTLSLERSLASQGFLSQILDSDLFQTDTKVNLSCSNTTQISRSQYTDTTVKEFTPHMPNCWLPETQTSDHSTMNRPSETQLSDPTHLLGSGGQNVWTACYPDGANTSSISSSQGNTAMMNRHYSNASYSLGAPVSRISRMLSKPSGVGSRRPSGTGRRCTRCHKILHFVSNAQFLDHEQKCTKEGMHLACAQCGRGFASKVALKDHVDSMHTKKGFQCRGCGMVFKWRTYVYQHRYKCPFYRIKREPM